MTDEERGEGRFHNTDKVGTFPLVNALMVARGILIIAG